MSSAFHEIVEPAPIEICLLHNTCVLWAIVTPSPITTEAFFPTIIETPCAIEAFPRNVMLEFSPKKRTVFGSAENRVLSVSGNPKLTRPKSVILDLDLEISAEPLFARKRARGDCASIRLRKLILLKSRSNNFLKNIIDFPQ
jgi:hypothetical protein